MKKLNNDKWKYRFSEVILERGEYYWMLGKVSDLWETNHGWKALVHGYHNYQVEIIGNENEVSDMYCTCPYARDHTYCKHMAAVLFGLQAGNDVEETAEPEESMEEILNRLSKEQLREELTIILQKDSNSYHRIYSKYHNGPSGEGDVKRIRNRLDNLKYEIGDRYGFIDWRSGSDYVREFCIVLSDMIEPLIGRQEYMIAFRAICEAFEELNRVEMDGSNGEYSDIAEDLRDYWDRVIHSVSKEEGKTIHSWFESKTQQARELICGDVLDDVLEQSFDDAEFLDPRLEEIRGELDNTEPDNRRTLLLLKKYRDFLKRGGYSEQELEQWLKEHEDSKSVRQIRLEQAEEAHDEEAVIRILNSMIASEPSGWEKHSRIKNLLEIYHNNGNQKKEMELLEALLLKEGYSSSSHLRRFRELVDPEKWPQIRDSYLNEHPDMKAEFYAEEQEYQKLFNCLKDRPIQELDAYRDILAEHYPDEMFAIYMNYLQELEKQRPGKTLYRQMKQYILFTSRIKGGEKSVLKLIREWQRQFPTRKLMQEMLRETRQLILAERDKKSM